MVLNGGHSGKDIDKNRGNPIIVLGNILAKLNTDKDLFLNFIDGGSWVTAIPRRVECVITTDSLDLEALSVYLQELENNLQAQHLQYVSISPNIENPHSPYERVSISSIQKMWEYIKEISKDLDKTHKIAQIQLYLLLDLFLLHNLYLYLTHLYDYYYLQIFLLLHHPIFL